MAATTLLAALDVDEPATYPNTEQGGRILAFLRATNLDKAQSVILAASDPW